MTDFSELKVLQTLRAAGLPTDLNAIIGGRAAFRRYNGKSGRYTVIGIDFGVRSVTLTLIAPDGIFKYRPVVVFDSPTPWEGYFMGEDEVEYLASFMLLRGDDW